MHAMWAVGFADEFDAEFDALDEPVQDELLAQLDVVRHEGPQARRPRVDTLNGSKHANMKELRFAAAGGEWRAAFAFDPRRTAIVLCAGNKAGAPQRQFYKALIRKADTRFDAHLMRLKEKRR
jgi:hypothetical protein